MDIKHPLTVGEAIDLLLDVERRCPEIRVRALTRRDVAHHLAATTDPTNDLTDYGWDCVAHTKEWQSWGNLSSDDWYAVDDMLAAAGIVTGE